MSTEPKQTFINVSTQSEPISSIHDPSFISNYTKFITSASTDRSTNTLRISEFSFYNEDNSHFQSTPREQEIHIQNSGSSQSYDQTVPHGNIFP